MTTGQASTLMGRVRALMDQRQLSLKRAAAEIGVGKDSLMRHLAGSYVRSDSQAKYRAWLTGDAGKTEDVDQLDMLPREHEAAPRRRRSRLEKMQLADPIAPAVPWRIVDLFSGCGGLSLGFELQGEGRFFKTALAIDLEDAMVDTLNSNHAAPVPLARKADLSDFTNETEVRAYYLNHLRSVETDTELDRLLAGIEPIPFNQFLGAVRDIDERFLEAFSALRATEAFLQAYADIDARILGQTSVVGFHTALRIPLPSSRSPNLYATLWSDAETSANSGDTDSLPGEFTAEWALLQGRVRVQLARRWEAELEGLAVRAKGLGRGQLASSGRRIAAFLEFLEQLPALREAWLEWRTARESLRLLYFGHPTVAKSISQAYVDERRVDVLLGGPPCQGFSRIGRGKIRSLRDDMVHVHYDSEAGDLRNRLFQKYVLFVSALAPRVFLFENVRHFQTEVKTPEGTFLATEVLREAVQELSSGGLDYELSSRTIMASDHGVPQTRDRFFMAGVRSDIAQDRTVPSIAEWMLALPVTTPVPLRRVLEDLPEPYEVTRGGASLDRTVSVLPRRDLAPSDPGTDIGAWLGRGSPPGQRVVDSHVARSHREDDRHWFAMMGPGKRWMDYRCDSSETLELIADLVTGTNALLRDLESSEFNEDLKETVSRLEERINGSLSLRLLLESIPAMRGEPGHHLLTATYLRKREGNHGDWLARLDGDKPSKTVVTHMGKDTYAYVHPWSDRTLSVREAARIQTFPDSFSFAHLGLVDAFRVIGNAVPPLLAYQVAGRVAELLTVAAAGTELRKLRSAG